MKKYNNFQNWRKIEVKCPKLGVYVKEMGPTSVKEMKEEKLLRFHNRRACYLSNLSPFTLVG
jgi:hypothetical protein